FEEGFLNLLYFESNVFICAGLVNLELPGSSGSILFDNSLESKNILPSAAISFRYICLVNLELPVFMPASINLRLPGFLEFESDSTLFDDSLGSKNVLSSHDYVENLV
ncbi:11503_t:CDS:2, partial [Racocetra persica]